MSIFDDSVGTGSKKLLPFWSVEFLITTVGESHHSSEEMSSVFFWKHKEEKPIVVGTDERSKFLVYSSPYKTSVFRGKCIIYTISVTLVFITSKLSLIRIRIFYWVSYKDILPQSQ